MNSENYVGIEPKTETFRGYITALDLEIEAHGSIAIPFIAFAKYSGADVDKVIANEDFERIMNETAEEFGAEIIKHDGFPTEKSSGVEQN